MIAFNEINLHEGDLQLVENELMECAGAVWERDYFISFCLMRLCTL